MIGRHPYLGIVNVLLGKICNTADAAHASPYFLRREALPLKTDIQTTTTGKESFSLMCLAFLVVILRLCKHSMFSPLRSFRIPVDWGWERGREYGYCYCVFWRESFRGKLRGGRQVLNFRQCCGESNFNPSGKRLRTLSILFSLCCPF